MKFITSGKNIEVTPGLKDAIEQKLGKLESTSLLKQKSM